MADLLRKNVQRTINYTLSDEEYHSLSKSFFKRSFDKKAILAEEGKTCRYVYFILKGSCYSYLVNGQGDKHAAQFAIEEHWITDQYSFFSHRKGIYTIETLEPTDALVLNRENFDELCKSSHLFEHFMRVLMQNAFIATQYRLSKTNSQNAENRYLEFSKLYPQFTQRIP